KGQIVAEFLGANAVEVYVALEPGVGDKHRVGESGACATRL
ncbi:MAG: hypothetical protein ACI9HE_003839, partial [Planctomycetota bacterium]